MMKETHSGTAQADKLVSENQPSKTLAKSFMDHQLLSQKFVK
jgi:hypothetical protein